MVARVAIKIRITIKACIGGRIVDLDCILTPGISMTEASSERNPVERLAEEFLERFRQGGRPSLAEYIARHAEHADEIRELFPMLLELEGAASPLEAELPGEDESLPQQLGDYLIVREIGRGGMGIVYEAVQQTLGRSVALKVLPCRNHHDELALERFRREARIAAKLHHTNIVPVFDVGQEGTTSYYAMQFIEGESFDKVVRELRCRMAPTAVADSDGKPNATVQSGASDADDGSRAVTRVFSNRVLNDATTIEVPQDQLTPESTDETGVDPLKSIALPTFDDLNTASDYRCYFRSVAVIGSQVAQALAYAHARGVVHRDIKPSNLLLDANGVVWVTDFGMAKIEADPLTRTGDILGTIHYMAPERFKGQCDVRADIYALGLTLYELLTLRPAFDTTDRLQLVDLISKQNPSRPRLLNAAIPRDLETIVLKAIDKDPKRRYQSADELSDDFQCFLEDRPILTRRVGPLEHFVRWARRNPVLSGLSVAMFLILMLAAVGATITAVVLKNSSDRATKAENKAKQNLQVSELNAEQLLQQNYINHVNLAYLEFRNNNVARAQEYLQNCDDEMRGWEWDYVDGHCRVALRTFAEHGQSVNCVALSPDDRWIAVGTGNFLDRRGPPGDLVVRELATGEARFAPRKLANGVSAVAFSPDGQSIASANRRTLTVWNAETGEKLFETEGESHDLLCLEFSPDGSVIAGGFGRFNGAHVGHAKIWNAKTGEQIGKQIPGKRGGFWDLAFDPTGRRLALTAEGLVEVFDLERRESVATFSADVGFIYCVAFHPEGRYVAAGGLDSKIRLWDVENGELVGSYAGHDGFVRGLAFSADGQRMISASEDKSLRLWDTQSEREIAIYRGHTHFVNCVAFSTQDEVFASGSLDRTVKVWYATAEHQMVYQGHREEGHVRALAFSPSGHAVASGSMRFAGPRGRLHLWDPNTGQQLLRFPKSVDEVTSVAFRPDGVHLVAGHISGLITVWDATTAELCFRLDAHVGEVADVAYSPDGSLLASVGQDTGLYIWNATTGALVRAGKSHQAFITAVEFSPDGEKIATASEDGTVKLWENATARVVRTMTHPGGEARGVAFCRDGLQLISTGGIDHRRGDVIVWDVETGEMLRRLPGHTDIVYDVAFSPDGRRFATASDDRTIKLWDNATRHNVFTIRGHTGGVVGVEFSPDGRMIVSGSVDRRARVWSLDPPTDDIYHRREAVADLDDTQSLLETQQWEAAISSLDRAITRGLDGIQVRLDRATAWRHHNEDNAAGEMNVEELVDQVPHNARQLVRLGLRLARRGFPSEAANVADLAVERTPDDTVVLTAAGRIHAAADQLEIAKRNFQSAISQVKSAGEGQSEPWWWGTGWWTTEPLSSPLSDRHEAEQSASPFELLEIMEVANDQEVGQVRWLTISADSNSYLDFREPFSTTGRVSHYATQHLYSSEEQTVALLVGADDGMRIWLNDQLVFQQTRLGESRFGHRAINVTLKAGWNTVLVKLANRSGLHGMYFAISDHARDRARGVARLRQVDPILAIWDAASSVERDDPQLLSLAGHALAQRGRWSESAEVFQRLIERQPARNRNWVTLAPLLVYTGQMDQYARFRRELLQAFSSANDPLSAERTSKACLLIPVSRSEAATPARLAAHAAQVGANHDLLPYLLFAKGMSEYRVGEPQAAVATLQESLSQNRSRWPYLDVVIHMFLAMSHYELAEPDLANQHFEEGTKIFDGKLPAVDSADFGADWLDWLICEIARREAKQLLGRS